MRFLLSYIIGLNIDEHTLYYINSLVKKHYYVLRSKSKIKN